MSKLRHNYKETVKVYQSNASYVDFGDEINEMLKLGWKVKALSTSTAIGGTGSGYSMYHRTVCVVSFYNYDFIDLTKKKENETT